MTLLCSLGNYLSGESAVILCPPLMTLFILLCFPLVDNCGKVGGLKLRERKNVFLWSYMEDKAEVSSCWSYQVSKSKPQTFIFATWPHIIVSGFILKNELILSAFPCLTSCASHPSGLLTHTVLVCKLKRDGRSIHTLLWSLPNWSYLF